MIMSPLSPSLLSLPFKPNQLMGMVRIDATTPQPTSSGPVAVFRPVDTRWELVWNSPPVLLPHRVGLGDYHTLLRRRGEAVLSLQLSRVGTRRAGHPRAAGWAKEDPKTLARHGISVGSGRTTSRDDLTASLLKAQLGETKEELRRCQANNDLAGATRAQTDLDALHKQFVQNFVPSGAERPSYDPALQRARRAVQKRIQEANDLVRQHLPGMADHLKEGVQTGFSCRYSHSATPDWILW